MSDSSKTDLTTSTAPVVDFSQHVIDSLDRYRDKHVADFYKKLRLLIDQLIYHRWDMTDDDDTDRARLQDELSAVASMPISEQPMAIMSCGRDRACLKPVVDTELEPYVEMFTVLCAGDPESIVRKWAEAMTPFAWPIECVYKSTRSIDIGDGVSPVDVFHMFERSDEDIDAAHAIVFGSVQSAKRRRIWTQADVLIEHEARTTKNQSLLRATEVLSKIRSRCSMVDLELCDSLDHYNALFGFGNFIGLLHQINAAAINHLNITRPGVLGFVHKLSGSVDDAGAGGIQTIIQSMLSSDGSEDGIESLLCLRVGARHVAQASAEIKGPMPVSLLNAASEIFTLVSPRLAETVDIFTITTAELPEYPFPVAPNGTDDIVMAISEIVQRMGAESVDDMSSLQVD